MNKIVLNRLNVEIYELVSFTNRLNPPDWIDAREIFVNLLKYFYCETDMSMEK